MGAIDGAMGLPYGISIGELDGGIEGAIGLSIGGLTYVGT